MIHFFYNNKIDIVAVSETKLDQSTTIRCPGYLIYRADQSRRGEGVAIHLRDTIRHNAILRISLRTLQVVGIELETEYDSDTLLSVYRSLKNIRYFIHELNYLFNKFKNVIIIGDLNAKDNVLNQI